MELGLLHRLYMAMYTSCFFLMLFSPFLTESDVTFEQVGTTFQKLADVFRSYTRAKFKKNYEKRAKTRTCRTYSAHSYTCHCDRTVTEMRHMCRYSCIAIVASLLFTYSINGNYICNKTSISIKIYI